jgi:hypothetical protein
MKALERKKIIACSILLSAILFFGFNSDIDGQVKVSSDSLVLPTYIVDPPSTLPRFYEGRSHQGVKRRMYPYP